MKDHLRELVGQVQAGLDPRSVVREYVQARILGALQRAGAMMALAFHGGTALRFLYRIPRFSEDLAFTLERQDRGFELAASLSAVRSELEAEGYEVGLRLTESAAVHHAFVLLPGLLYELELSPHRAQVLRVKIEIDTRPPAGAGLDTTLVRRYVTLRLHHHDRPTLLAGKLHAVLQRSWTKGRDLFDLLWYLSDREWPAPNLALLNNALRQSGWQGDELTADSWRGAVRDRVSGLDWKRVVADVRPFLEPGAEVELLTADNLLSLL